MHTDDLARTDRLAQGMGAALLAMGTAHMAVPQPFDALIPEELPLSKRTWTIASGVAELGVGGALLVPRTRRAGALAAALLFIGVFPGNLNMVRLWKDKPLPMRAIAWARLPLQFPMIWAALRVYRGTPAVAGTSTTGRS